MVRTCCRIGECETPEYRGDIVFGTRREGELNGFSIAGGSGKELHYYFCPQCSIIVYNKPDALDGMIYLPAGLLADQIEFSPTVELWAKSKANWLP